MTAPRRDLQETEFQQWLREHPELDSRMRRLSVTDCDMWVHRYSQQRSEKRRHATDIRDVFDSIMLVEVKTHAADIPYAQHDTLTLVDALLRRACMGSGGRRRHVVLDDAHLGNSQKRQVRCFGVHLLVMSGGRPDRSTEIRWDRSFLQEEHLLELLRFERDPDSPSRMLDTRRHHVVRGAPTLQLFDATTNAA